MVDIVLEHIHVEIICLSTCTNLEATEDKFQFFLIIEN